MTEAKKVVETKNTKAKTKAPKVSKAEKTVEKLTKNTTEVATRKQRDMNEMIPVICITNTPLTYLSKAQQGYRVDWSGFLEENWVEYKELVNMRGSQKSFFEEPWIICEWDVLEDLRVTQYYENIIDLEGLDELFGRNIDSLVETLKVVPKGIKKLIVDRAFELIRSGELDSLNTIKAIEDTYKIDLTV